MRWELIVIIVLAVVVFVLFLVCIALWRRQKRNAKRSEEHDLSYAEEARIRGGVRYSDDDAIRADGKPRVGLRRGDILLQRGQPQTARRGGDLMPGAYTVLAAQEGTLSFKLRLGGLVRTYAHGDRIVLAEDEEICAVSCTVILR